jgi:phospholipase C
LCGDLTNAFDFTAPVYGLPRLPATTVIGDPAGGSYNPPVATNSQPKQEPGSKRARPLPYQPNANLDGFTFGSAAAIEANLSFSNNGSHVTKASHFSVYNNAAPDLSLADYPTRYPSQHTVDPSHTIWNQTVAGSVEIGAGQGDGVYDLTVVGPNRFLRHFTGDVNAIGRGAQVEASYYQGRFGVRPKLALKLINNGSKAATFTVTSNSYGPHRSTTYHVGAHGSATHSVDPLISSAGWYDLSVTILGDGTWSRRYVGHLENGTSSVTG